MRRVQIPRVVSSRGRSARAPASLWNSCAISQWLPEEALWPHQQDDDQRQEHERVLELGADEPAGKALEEAQQQAADHGATDVANAAMVGGLLLGLLERDRKSTRLNSSHLVISIAVFR